MKKLVVILMCLLSLAACRGKKHKQGDDRSNNEFYAEYVRIYKAYSTVPTDTTEAALQAYLVKFPNNSQAWTFMARVYLDKNQNNKAEAAYRHVLLYNPKYGPAMSGLGTIYSWDSRMDSALILLHAAVTNGDSSYYTYLNIAIAELKKNDTASAAKEMVFFAKPDSLNDDLLKYLVVISGEVNDRTWQQRALAVLSRHNAEDPLLDQYMAKKIKALDYFDEKRKQLNDRK